MIAVLTYILNATAAVLLVLFAAWCAVFILVRLCHWLPKVSLWRLRRETIVVLIVVAAIAIIKAQKGDRGGTHSDPPVAFPQTGTTGVPPVENEITNTLHFAAIDVHTNGTATLLIAWPL